MNIIDIDSNNRKNFTELSKEISYALRHAPWEYELEMDEDGEGQSWGGCCSFPSVCCAGERVVDSHDSVFGSKVWFLRVLLFASEKTTREGGG